MPFRDRDDGDDTDASLALLSAEEADDAAADRRLRPAADTDGEPQHRSTLLTVTPWILGNEFCERLAYYGCVSFFIDLLLKACSTTGGIRGRCLRAHSADGRVMHLGCWTDSPSAQSVKVLVAGFYICSQQIFNYCRILPSITH